jgi:hypothetical protein
MDKRISSNSHHDNIARAVRLLPGAQHLLETLPSETPEPIRRRRRNAIQVFAQCCEIWKLADQANLFAVRDKIEPAILLAYDACFQPRQASS